MIFQFEVLGTVPGGVTIARTLDIKIIIRNKVKIKNLYTTHQATFSLSKAEFLLKNQI